MSPGGADEICVSVVGGTRASTAVEGAGGRSAPDVPSILWNSTSAIVWATPIFGEDEIVRGQPFNRIPVPVGHRDGLDDESRRGSKRWLRLLCGAQGRAEHEERRQAEGTSHA